MTTRAMGLILLGILSAGCAPGRIAAPPAEPAPAGSPAVSEPSSSPRRPSQGIDFESRVRPILEADCKPCHFEGGKVYALLPFDRAETIRQLGTGLFTRIKDEEERAIIRAFLEQTGGEAPPPPAP